MKQDAPRFLLPRPGRTQLLLCLAGVTVLAGLVHHFGVAPLFAVLAHLDPRLLVGYAILAILIRWIACLRWASVGRCVGAPASLPGLFAARLSGDALSSLVPAGRLSGDPLRILMLRRRGIPGINASAGVAMDRFMEVTGNTIAVLAYIPIYTAAHALPHASLVVTGIGALLGGLVVTGMALRYGRAPFSYPLRFLADRLALFVPVADAVRRTEETVAEFLQRHATVFFAGILISLLLEAAAMLEFKFLLAAFGLPSDLPTVVLVLLGSGLARAVPSPGGLGALEATQVAMLGWSSGRADVGFVVGVVLRLDDVIWTLAGLAAFSLSGIPAEVRCGRNEGDDPLTEGT